MTSDTSSEGSNSAPKTGDQVFVFWLGHGWFTATIEQCLSGADSCMVRWTDGNWAAERALYSNLFLDKVPDQNDIKVGDRVLFKQGLYYCGQNEAGDLCDDSGRDLSESHKQVLADKRQVSDRWHLGLITQVLGDLKAEPVYNGQHVGKDDPKVSKDGYIGYNFSFEELKIEDLRIPISNSTPHSSIPPLQISIPPSDNDPVPIGMPKSGDGIFVSWLGYGWFTATVEQCLPGGESCLVRWTDGNWSPEEALYKDLIIDRTPDPKVLVVGSKVLFPQGRYYCSNICDGTGRDLTESRKEQLVASGCVSDRWHVGEITSVVENEDGGMLYCGKHLDKDDSDFLTDDYEGYNKTFEGLKLSTLRDSSRVGDYSNAVSEEANLEDVITVRSDNAVSEEANPEDVITVRSDKSVIKPILEAGARCFIYWLGHGWFKAKVERCVDGGQSYMVKWVDGNWCAEKAEQSNVLPDTPPEPCTLEVGTTVLFKQGLYYCGANDDGVLCEDSGRDLSESKKRELADKRQISERWHLGVVKKIRHDKNSGELITGEHVSQRDAQYSKTGYLGYSNEFVDLPMDSIRVLDGAAPSQKERASSRRSFGQVILNTFTSFLNKFKSEPSDDNVQSRHEE